MTLWRIAAACLLAALTGCATGYKSADKAW